MARHKCAYNCENSSDADIKFFKFPLYNPRKLKKWLANMKWEEWTPNRFSVLCINHFEEQYINRAGKSVTLRDDAVPTIFSENTLKEKPPISSKRKRNKPAAEKATKKDSAQSNSLTTAQQSSRSKEQTPGLQDPPRDPQMPERLRVIVDEELMKIKSFPHFFHGDYCVPQNIHWAPDDNFTTEHKDCENVIEVKEPWQWLGLDVRGPLPQTLNGHKYILTMTDFYSKWVEAVPMRSYLPPEVAKNVMDVIAHFGYPIRILSRLPHDVVQKINLELKEKLNMSISLLVHHQQTGTADVTTLQMIDRMVSDLMEQHAADWDVFLPAQVFSLCFKEHSETKERPFSALCCKGLEPVRAPRGLNLAYSQIKESVFIVRSKLSGLD